MIPDPALTRRPVRLGPALTARRRRRRALSLAALAALLALSGCSGGSARVYYRKHPHALMGEVVRCENNGGALAATPSCQKALQFNHQLFGY